MRYTLIGGHSAGRVVEVGDPAPPFLCVAYRVPADPIEAAALAYGPDGDPSRVTLGIETYELQELIVDHGPPVRIYVGPDLRK